MQTQIKHHDLLKAHRELLSNHMNHRPDRFPFTLKNKILRLYDHKIDHKNIKNYYNAKIPLFIVALASNKLDAIKNYFLREDEPETISI